MILKHFNTLFGNLYFLKTTIDDSEIKQDEFNAKLGALNRYFPKNERYIEAKKYALG